MTLLCESKFVCWQYATRRSCLSQFIVFQPRPANLPFRWKLPGPWLGPLIFFRLITVAFRAFSFFFSSTTLETPAIYFHIFIILCAISLRENTQRSESWGGTENNSLATSSNTWQTEDYFFNKKFYLNTLNPKETRKHNGSSYFIFEVDFLLINWNSCSLRANVSVPLRSGISTWSPMARWWPAVLLCTSRCVM